MRIGCRRRPARGRAPSSTRLSSEACSEAGGISATAASSSRENSRPIVAATWATHFASPSRSSRAISESWIVAGMSTGDRGWRSPERPCSPPNSAASSSDLVSSSTNSGTPSVAARICSVSSLDSIRPSVRPVTRASLCSRPSRSRVSSSTSGASAQGGRKSERNAISARIGAARTRRISSPNHSRVVGSAQCRSSTNRIVGRAAERLRM